MLRPILQQVSELNIQKLDFEITLSGTYWGNRNPAFEILVNDQIVVDSVIAAPPSKKGIPGQDFMTATQVLQTLHTEKFSIDLGPGQHVLGIRLKNKLPTDTCGFNDNGTYTRDVLLNIEKVKIDSMDLENLIYEESIYELDSPAQINGTELQMLERCVNLGFNGVYKLRFSIPFYIWLLERL